MKSGSNSDKICKPGCSCNEGYVRDTVSGKCVLLSNCDCHHGNQMYKSGQTIKEDCNDCVCRDGGWQCTTKVCSGICTAWGDSHYKSFDGKMFEFFGSCDYVLAQGQLSYVDNFRITIQNVLCGSNGITCAKSLTLQVGPDNSKEVVIFAKHKPVSYGNKTRTIIREAGVFIFAEVPDMGIVLQWDRGTRAYIILDPMWKNKVSGICGNYNDDLRDDFKSPSGLKETSSRIFGDSWRLRSTCYLSKTVDDPCKVHDHRVSWAKEKCGILKSKVFETCHSEVPYQPYYERFVSHKVNPQLQYINII